jgi:hypothetical protein
MPKGTSDLIATPLADIPTIVERARLRFASGVTKDLSWRKDQLRHMYDMLEENKEAITDAMQKVHLSRHLTLKGPWQGKVRSDVDGDFVCEE